MTDVPGLRYVPDYVDAAQERALLETIDAQPWLTELRRRVQHYGWRYDYKARKVDPGMYLGPLPAWAQAVAEELHARGLMPRVADQLIVNEYLPGQGIAPHVDCVPCFAEGVASLTLESGCVMEFTHVRTRRKVAVPLAARSLVVLTGEARYDWRHGIAPRKSDGHGERQVERGRRVSLTFRNVLVSREGDEAEVSPAPG